MAEVSREEMVKGLREFLLEQPLDDARYSKMVTAVAKIRNLLTGPPQPLTDTERTTILEKIKAAKPDQPHVRSRLALYMLECCAVGESSALVTIAEEFLAGQLTKNDVRALAGLINRLGFALRPDDAALAAIRDLLLRTPPESSVMNILLKLAGLAAEYPEDARDAAFRSVFLPVMDHVAESRSLDAVLQLEDVVYNNYIKVRETPEHHKQAFAAIEPIIGKAVARRSGTLAAAQSGNSATPRVAFLLANGHYLAHTEVLIAFLEGLKGLPNPQVQPLVFLLADRGREEISGPLQRVGVPLLATELPPEKWLPSTAFQNCRDILARENIDAVVFVSLPMFLAYCTEAPLAPVQIWWSMKFALPNFPKLDGRVFYRSLFNQSFELEGVTWRGGPLGLAPPPEADDAAVRAIRAKLNGFRILGTIARAEKIREPGFLDMVVRLLRRHPDACFLWTGRSKLPEIDAHFAAGGVAERCHFIGWVDPGIYLRVFDLFLETYPLTGLMAAWSMALAKPVVSVGRLGFLGTYLEGIFDGGIPCPPGERERLDQIFAPLSGRLPNLWADTPAGMDAIADALLADPVLARDCGLAQQAFIRTYLSDPVSSAAVQAGHFRSIIDEKRQAG